MCSATNCQHALVNTKNANIPIISGDISITTELPLLAIKQYEAALNVGMNPSFSAEAKKKVDDFVKKQLNTNAGDKQMSIEVPLGSSQVSGEQVLQRVIRASNDGFIVTLNLQAQSQLRAHIASSTPIDPSLQFDLPPKHSHQAALVNNLLGIGLLPNTMALGEHKLKDLRKMLSEDTISNQRHIVVDSGNIGRDFQVLKVAIEELGQDVRIVEDEEKIKAFRKHVGETLLREVDLKNIAAQDQVAFAQRLAQKGVFAKITAPVKSGEEILIRSTNTAHAKEMFQKYLNQGFRPVGNKRFKEISENGLFIKIEGNNPKEVWERMEYCAKSGFRISLSPDQMALMKPYIEKNKLDLPIHGYGWDTVKHNIELANELGLSIRGITNEAKVAYLEEQIDLKSRNIPEMPRIDIVPIQKTESRFLRSDRQVNDRDKTKYFADTLIKHGFNLSMAKLADMEAEIMDESKKTKWFGLSKTPTAKAEQASKFIQIDLAYIKSNIKSQASNFVKATIESLQNQAKELLPTAQIKGLPKEPRQNIQRPAAYVTTTYQKGNMSTLNVPGSYVANTFSLSKNDVLQKIKDFRNDLQIELNTGGIVPNDYKKISDDLDIIVKDIRESGNNLAQVIESHKNTEVYHPRLKALLTHMLDGPAPRRPSAAPSA